MGRFLIRKQCAKEAEVEEVHMEKRISKHRRNEIMYEFNEKWKDSHPLLSAVDGKTLSLPQRVK